MRTRTIVWLTVGPTACGSYRCYVPSLALAETGRYRSRFINVAHSSGPTRQQIELLRGCDAAVLQRNVSAVGEQWKEACRTAGLPMLYDIDDDLFQITPRHPFYERFGDPRARERLRGFVQAAVHVIVSTEPLSQSMEEACGLPSSRISVACNHLHEAVWGAGVPAERPASRGNGSVVIGWQGTPTHDDDFEPVVPALARVLSEFPEVRLCFFGDIPGPVVDALPGDRLERRPPVLFKEYPNGLRDAAFDIGIAPLADSRFNCGKSNVKWLEYSACRIPTVASRVGPYAASVVHGTTGLLAETTDEWHGALATLIAQRDAREAMADRARATAWQEWSAASRGRAWVELFDGVF